AQENFDPKGNNRILLATDGDFNVGVSGKGALENLIEEKRKSGIFLTVLGFGTGNLKDEKMETLANKGNGNYAYIDTFLEAHKVLVREFGGTLFTIAKDVKFQLEFNPAQVAAYRLIGYENRMLKAQDFNDDTKDAGELGAGHSVVALYELIPAKSGFAPRTDPLKYQKRTITSTSKDWCTLKLRYKSPQGEKSRLLVRQVGEKERQEWRNTSENFRFASAIAQFGMLIRESPYKGTATYKNLYEEAKASFGKDEYGYRRAFGNLVEATEKIWGIR
ncbi:MAG: YfbK domain-containing protein, partial [Bacteroidota bacterium]